MRYLLFTLLAMLVTTATAQPTLEIESSSAHRVTVINELGQEVRLKLMGYRPDAHFLANLPANGSTTQNFYAGERVVCVWDHQRRLILAARVNVNQRGTLRLRMPIATVATRQTDSPQGYNIETALPMLQLEN